MTTAEKFRVDREFELNRRIEEIVAKLAGKGCKDRTGGEGEECKKLRTELAELMEMRARLIMPEPPKELRDPSDMRSGS